MYHYTSSSVIHIYIFTNIWKIENNNENIKIKRDNNWHQTSNNYACWHNTFFSFCFIVPYHAPFLEVQDRRHCADCVCLDRTDHACLSTLCLCPFRCPSAFLFPPPPPPSVRHTSPIPQHANWASAGGGVPSTRVSLSTAINKDFFSWHFQLCDSLCTCYLKLLKDCADVPSGKRPCTHQRVTQHVWMGSCSVFLFGSESSPLNDRCSSSPVCTRPPPPHIFQ